MNLAHNEQQVASPARTKKDATPSYAKETIKTIYQNKQTQSFSEPLFSLKPCLLVFLCVSVRVDILAVGCFAVMHLRLFAENGSAALRPSGWQPDIRQNPEPAQQKKWNL